MSKVIFETKDCDYGMKLTIDWNKLIKVEPHDKGTELSEKDVVKLISVLSNWLNERKENERYHLCIRNENICNSINQYKYNILTMIHLLTFIPKLIAQLIMVVIGFSLIIISILLWNDEFMDYGVDIQSGIWKKSNSK